ncbi:unnamed protein product, partial [Acanthocheilonema viteae]
MTGMAGFIVYDAVTGTSGTLCKVGLSPKVDYLAELSKKPTIEIKTYCDSQEGFELAQSILSSNIPPTTEADLATAYIAKVIGTISGILDVILMNLRTCTVVRNNFSHLLKRLPFMSVKLA